jgi:hypothetical protein
LWWVEHEDPRNPQYEEFVLPPLIEGLAYADDPNEDDLEFSFEGEVYTPPSPPEEAPYPVTGALAHEFTCYGELDPFEFGLDEPVEVPENPPVKP